MLTRPDFLRPRLRPEVRGQGRERGQNTLCHTCLGNLWTLQSSCTMLRVCKAWNTFGRNDVFNILLLVCQISHTVRSSKYWSILLTSLLSSVGNIKLKAFFIYEAFSVTTYNLTHARLTRGRGQMIEAKTIAKQPEAKAEAEASGI